MRVPFHFLATLFHKANNDDMLQSITIQSSTIELCNLTFHAYHGVLPEERLLGNTFTVDLTLEADISQAVVTDDLSGTINYAEAYEVVKHEMNIPSQLLEHVCGRIGKALLHRYPTLKRVKVRVAKHNPPIEGAGTCQSAVTIEFTH